MRDHVMKIHFLSRSLNDDGHVSRNNSAGHLQACASIAEISELSIPSHAVVGVGVGVAGLNAKVRSFREMPALGRSLIDRIKEETSSPGPHVLLHTVMSPWDLRVARRLGPVWDRFDHRVANVIENVDSVNHVTRFLSQYDIVTCFCDDLRGDIERDFDVPTLHWPSHTDVLDHASVGDQRPIDLLEVGRRDRDRYHRMEAFFRASPDRPFMLDFSTRPNPRHPAPAATEFARLMNTYARAHVALCESPASNVRFKGRGPLTARWVHAWTSGCTVIGTRPGGRGVDRLVDWPESTLELPGNPDDQIPFILEVLADRDGLKRRRHRNVIEALRRHDTRHRLASLFDRLGLTRPDRLSSKLASIESKAVEIEATLAAEHRP